MRRILLIALCLITCFNLFSQVRDDKYIFETPPQGSGFTFGQIAAIATDKNDMPWFACDNGLYYYNTKRFVRYAHDKNNPASIPSNTVVNLLNDSRNRLWVVTSVGVCYYDFESDSFIRVEFNIGSKIYVAKFIEYNPDNFLVVVDSKLYTFSYDNIGGLRLINTPIHSNISTLYSDDNGMVYLGYEDGSIFISDSSLEDFHQFIDSSGEAITAICEQESQLYVGYNNNGLNVINSEGEVVESYRELNKEYKYRLPHNNVKTIIKRGEGEIWVGTAAGLLIIDNGEPTTIKANEQNQLPRNSIYTLHVDKKNSVWIGTWAGRIAYYNESNYRFKFSIKENPDRAKQSVGLVHHFAPNSKLTTWVGDEWNGISLYNHNTNKFTKSYRSDLRIKALHKDSKNNLWIGTVFQGLYRMNTEYRKIHKVTIPSPFNGRDVLAAIASDDENNILWVGSRESGILRFNTESREYKIFDYRNTKGMSSNRIWALQLIENNLLIASDAGFTILDCQNEKFTTYNFNTEATNDNCSYSICYDEANRDVYIGTQEHGVILFDLETLQYKEFAPNDKLDKYRIYNVMMDNNSLLWFSTNNGIYRYSPQSEKLDNFTQSDGLASLQFHPASCVVTPDNTLIFGSTNGFYYINADEIKNNNTAPSTFVSNIYINGRPLPDADYKYVNSLHPADVKYLELSHNNNSLTFEVASNNMLKPKNCTFEYRLVGYQNKWIALDAVQDITFTKLPFGRYTLEIRSCNNDGLWGEVNSAKIRIHAPFYLMWYAILVYLLIIIAIMWYAVRETEFRIKAKRDLELERQINIINNKTFNEKARFFMNISHELRTPLSLIKAPLGILERETTAKDSLLHINAIKRNTERLLRLTNQILDFRLLEAGKLKTHISKHNITELCIDTYTFFEYHIKDHGINFSFEKPASNVYASVDGDMIGKVIYNLLGNAFKYSNDGASITIKLESCKMSEKQIEHQVIKGSPVTGDAVVITIEDSGIGIDEEQLQHVFDRFFYNTNEAYSSSGIGLHMCMEYVNLHNGNISATSKEGVGSKFTVVIPCNIENATAEEGNQKSPLTIVPFKTTTEEIETVPSFEKSQHKTTILIIDDNSEIRFYLKKILSQSYNCITAKNGQLGYDLAIDIKPNLIILDVLMPIMGGIDCAEKLRDNPITKLTPIIMLTGLADDNKMIQGVKAGADAYLSKPIDEAVLFAHIERLIERNTNIQSTLNTSEPKANKKATGAQSFTKTIEQIMEQNLQNSILDVNLIAQELQVSRSTLQRNFKTEIGMGVAEYIRDYRLRSAIKLMESGVYNIDELSTCVGFNSSSYFCKAFKDKYGLSPKKYCDTLKIRQ